MNKMKIEIWSDIACPYCYIGKRLMANALSKFPHSDKIQIIRRSYELNPALPKAPLEKTIYSHFAAQHNITEKQQKENMKDLLALAREVGLEYDFDKLVVTNTSDALRMIKLSAVYNLAADVEEILFKAYFIDGENVSDHATLVRLGTAAGLPQSEIEAMLNGNIYTNGIKEDLKYADESLNLEYIPFYLFNEKNAIQGSLPSETYLKMLTTEYEKWKSGDTSDATRERIEGRACSIDGHCSL
ncbi:MAG: DsbA family oxidoreductase [Tannerellaceae bacterium]|jgi:protein disulfide-isomerase|nr:DsbA family oxidoreductase [Tannerellaceae bacterium]